MSNRKTPDQTDQAASTQSRGTALPTGYAETLTVIKEQVAASRTRAVQSVNVELVCLYWRIGRLIQQRQQAHGWGTKVIERLSADLRHAFPGQKGFSARNLAYMRNFAAAWPDETILQQLAARIPWGHHQLLLDRLEEHAQRLFYVQKVQQHGWSRSVLAAQIDAQLHGREGKPISNFVERLPAADSDLVQQSFKDPYLLDFIATDAPLRERELEDALITHLERFLLELGEGFAFVGRQVELRLEGESWFVDLLFYHLRLRRFVVIELKAGRFLPEHAGKMNFYLNLVDETMRHPDDAPSIGLILCREGKQLVAEYALRDIDKPMAVAEWRLRLTRELPAELEAGLPSIEEIEQELAERND